MIARLVMEDGSNRNTSARSADPETVLIDFDGHGLWEVEVADRDARVGCETLDDARRVAYLYAARKRPCELIVRDAYHRVVEHELVDGAGTRPHPSSRSS